jgi:PD-(D/E)XK nuclease superfamily
MTKKIKISQSLIKAFTEDACPAMLKAVYIDKTIKITPGPYMVMGSYFEHLCLGAGHAHDDINVIDLPRLKSGEKSVNQQRIEAQALLFKQICEDRPIKIERMQFTLTLELDKTYHLEGTVDFEGYIDGNAEIALFDLKLTSSIYREHTYGGLGPWSWKHPYNMDWTQAFMYSMLYKELHGVEVRFYYLVFDYKPDAEYLIIRKKVERMHIMELNENIRKTIERIEFYNSSEWNYNASYKNCIQCPLKEECPAKTLQKPIVTI